MSTLPRDPDQIVAAWLDDGPTELPDETRRSIAVAARATPQSRARLAWRFPNMNTYAKLAVAAMAVIAVGTIGVAVLRPNSTSAPAGETNARPSPSAAESPSISPSPSAFVSLRTVETSTFRFPFGITAPSTWTQVIDDGDQFTIFRPGPSGGPVVGIDVSLVSNVYQDTCDPAAGVLDPPLGATAPDLVDFLLAAEPLHASRGGSAMIDGHGATVIDEAMTSTDRCTGGMVLWPTESGQPYVVYEVESKRFLVIGVPPELGQIMSDDFGIDTFIGVQRVVVTIVASDEARSAGAFTEAEAALATLDFHYF